ncbi:MAG: hypothetical protein EBZ76_08920 [Synechococcaceae bacterium WB9_2_170]|nr:hypothetical protein [Synechococcaceae bacterium WB6_3A_227]NDC15274.1 hypothetical protein [Synechococcaceae bacterium WB9_2_170]
MNPLPDRVVIVGLLATLGICFALVFWTVRLHPAADQPLQWRDSPSQRVAPSRQSGASPQLL